VTASRGRQPERTALAGQRTGLSAWVAALLLLRNGVIHQTWLHVTVGILALTAGAVAFGFRSPRPTASPAGRLRTLAGLVTATGVLTAAGMLHTA